MRVQTEEWRRFIPGMRMYKGKMTLFYNGEILWDRNEEKYVIYSEEERKSCKTIIVLPGVEVIPENTFEYWDIEIVIMSDTVVRIEDSAFEWCDYLKLVKFSRNLQYIGQYAFFGCKSLVSIFIPPSCREIEEGAFGDCKKLKILSVQGDTSLGRGVIIYTDLFHNSPFEIDEESGEYNDEDVNEWIRNINGHDDHRYALHRACSSYNPLEEIIHALVFQQGIGKMRMKNTIGITPVQYLDENPFADISEKSILRKYILDMIGEIV